MTAVYGAKLRAFQGEDAGQDAALHDMVLMEANVHEIVTGKVLAALRKGDVPWRKPWSSRRFAGEGMPRNAVSNRPYSGINIILLKMTPFGDPRWLTFEQAKALGGSVNKGEKSTLIVFWRIIEREVEDEDTGRKRIEEIPLLRSYLVFNVEQCSGLRLKPLSETQVKEFDPVEEAEKVIAGMPNPPMMDNRGGDRAFYIPSADRIHLPARAAFPKADEYYATAFHELGHSTGHKSRLDRFSKEDEPAIFGSPVYSREELVAEFCAAFLSATTGIETTTENSAAYIGGWMKKLQGDPKVAVTAAARGQKAADYILGDLGTEERGRGGAGTGAGRGPDPRGAPARHGPQRRRVMQHQHPEMAQIGPHWWSRLHQWAEDFRATVGPECGCGTFAVQATKALHDLINSNLGKPVQHPDNLAAFADGYTIAAQKIQTAQATVSAPILATVLTGVGLGTGFHIADALLKRRRGQAEQGPHKPPTDPFTGDLPPDDDKDDDDIELGQQVVTVREMKSGAAAPGWTRYSYVRAHHRQAKVSNLLDILLNGVAQATGATVAATMVSRALGGAPMTSPEEAVKVIDDRTEQRKKEDEEEKARSSGVHSPETVEGDQATVNVGTLLEEIDEILKDPSKQGRVDPKTLKVVQT